MTSTTAASSTCRTAVSMFVKICGITNEDDALLAVAIGADAVGFVFAPSARQIAPARRADITRRLPPEMMTVGVFRDEAPERVVEIVHTAGLRARAAARSRDRRDDPLRRRSGAVRDQGVRRRRPVTRTRARPMAPMRSSSIHPSRARARCSTGPLRKVRRGTRVILAGGLDPDNVARRDRSGASVGCRRVDRRRDEPRAARIR